MLAEKFARAHYRAWIPGCLRRIGEVIARFDYFSDSAEILYQKVPQFRLGFDKPWESL
jgi:hypothetical protein